jgi:hypothetical protein
MVLYPAALCQLQGLQAYMPACMVCQMLHCAVAALELLQCERLVLLLLALSTLHGCYCCCLWCCSWWAVLQLHHQFPLQSYCSGQEAWWLWLLLVCSV